MNAGRAGKLYNEMNRVGEVWIMITDKQRLSALAEQIVNGITSENNPAVFTGRGKKHYMEAWDWFQGVALFGLYEYYRDTKSKEVFAYLIKWFDEHIEAGLPEKNVNSMCPLLTLSYLYEETGKTEYLDICREWVEYAINELPRTTEKGFQHKTIDSMNYMQLWDDTLYMTVLFVARMGTLTGNDSLIQESIRQFLVHIKYLSDPVTGLFRHGFNFDGKTYYAGALWGRGNAWYTAGLVDYLDMAVVPDGVKWFLISSLQRQIDALVQYQDTEGMWHTLVNEPESSYAESSATAGFAYGILKAARLGYIDPSCEAYGLKALDAILKRIDADGILTGVSAGTCLMDTLDGYRSIPINAQPYGQSMALLLILEALRRK